MTTSRIRELAEQHWNGEGDLVHAHHPVAPVERREAEEILDGVLYVKSIASISAIDTGDGLVMLDTGGPFDAEHIFEAVRAWRPGAPVGGAWRRRCSPTTTSTTSSAPACSRPRPERALAGADRLRARGHAGRLPALRADPGLEHRHQPAPVRPAGRRVRSSRRVPLPRHHLPGPADVPSRRRRPSSSTTAWARPTMPPGRGSQSDGSSTPATCSSGPSPTPATPRRCSATPASGRPRCGRWPGWARRSCWPATACPSSAPTASARRSSTRPTCWRPSRHRRWRS